MQHPSLLYPTSRSPHNPPHRNPTPPNRQDPPPDLQAALPSLQELDLTDNLLWRWHEPAQLLHALPRLHTLNLSANRLQLAPPLSPGPPLASLRALILNGCGVGWGEVCRLQAAALPCLRELHVAGNIISSLQEEGEDGRSEGSGGEAAAGLGPGQEGAANKGRATPPPLRALQGIEVRRCLGGLSLGCDVAVSLVGWWARVRSLW